MSNGGESGIVNLGIDGTGFSIHDLMFVAQNVVGMALLTKYEVGRRRAGDRTQTYVEIDEAKTLLDWEPTYG